MWVLFAFVASLWIVLVNMKTMLIDKFMSKISNSMMFTFGMFTFIFSISLIVFFLLKGYLQMWNIIEQDGPADKMEFIVIIQIWVFLGLFILFAKIFYTPLQFLKLAKYNSMNESMIMKSLQADYEKNWILKLYKNWLINNKDNNQFTNEIQ